MAKYPTVNENVGVGCICETNFDGKLEVIKCYRTDSGIYKCTVKFLETSNIYEVARQSLKLGQIKDNKKDRTPSFIEKCKVVHKDTYDYSKTIFKRGSSKITVICKLHGEFHVAAQSHLLGARCRKCAMKDVSDKNRKDTSWFINRAQSIFGDKTNLVNYSKVNYKGALIPVEIVCNTHGSFYVTPSNYFQYATPCIHCSEELRARNYSIPFEEFESKVKGVHGDRYILHKEDYKYMKEITRVTCREHGDWWIYPPHLLKGHGCAKCAGVALKTQEDFVIAANSTHKNAYDYSNSIFINNKSKITIRCPLHGEFKQNAGSHLSGRGCPSCAESGFDQTKLGSLYILESPTMIKVGITNRPVIKRVNEINLQAPEKFIIIKEYGLDGLLCMETEYRVLKWLRSNYKNPLIKFSGSTECFSDIPIYTVLNKVEEILNNG